MAQLWTKAGAEWRLMPVEGGCHAIDSVSVLQRTSQGGSWVLVFAAGQQVLVNGSPVPLGLRVLRDGDLIRTPKSAEMFFSTQRPAAIEPYADVDRPLDCRRCGRAINGGDATVTCPSCNAVYHQSDEYPCWTYRDKCNDCPQTTDLENSEIWTPEEL